MKKITQPFGKTQSYEKNWKKPLQTDKLLKIVKCDYFEFLNLYMNYLSITTFRKILACQISVLEGLEKV